MALDYAVAYPEEIEADLQLAQAGGERPAREGSHRRSSRFRQNESRAVIRALVAFRKAHGNEDWACREAWL